MKLCPRCKVVKPDEEFYKLKTRLTAYCKLCDNEKNRLKYKTDSKIRARAYQTNKKRRLANPRAYQAEGLRRSGGLTPDQYDEKVALQNGLCEICGGPPNGKWKKLQSDHDHESGEFRGLLCARCNMGLGRFKDNIDFLKRAILYLSRVR